MMNSIKHRRTWSEIERHVVGYKTARSYRHPFFCPAIFDVLMSDADTLNVVPHSDRIAAQMTASKDRSEVLEVRDVIDRCHSSILPILCF